jgi:hypothetical protein
MGTIARVKQDDLLISGEIDERLPVIKNGLVAAYPLDGTTNGISFKNLMNTSAWTVGTIGNQGNYIQNGFNENQIINYNNPWGNNDIVWATLGNNSGSDDDGGWNYEYIPIDHTKKYRLSVWIRRENLGTGQGTTYFGCQAYTVTNLGSSTVNDNPYFYASYNAELNNNWVLMVAYIHPSNYAGSADSTSGMYTLNGNHVLNFTDYKWTSTATYGGHRTYLYYSTKTDERCYWCRPRFEICDGTESSITDLIYGNDDVVRPIIASNLTFEASGGEGVGVETTTQNYQAGIGMGIYNNYGSEITTTITALTDERLYNQGITRTTYKPTTTSSLNSCRADGHSHGVSLSLGTSLSGGYSYASSIYWRSSKSDTVVTGVAANIGGWFDVRTERLSNGWNRTTTLWYDSTTRSDSKFWSFYCPSLNLNEVITIDWSCPQLERTSFPTEYYNGTRGYGKLYYSPPSAIKSQASNFTIYIEAKNNKNTSSVLPNEIDIFCDDGDRWNGQLRATSGSLELLVRANGRGSTYNLLATCSTNPSDGKWHSYALVSESSGTRVYQDGNLIGNFASVYPQYVNNLSVSRNAISDEYVYGGVYRNLFIYNRALTTEEIVKLTNSNLNVDSVGNLYNTIEEKPQSLSLSAYFPLGSHSKDEMKVISPNSEANTVYRDGGVWVGTALTNLVAESSFESGYSSWGVSYDNSLDSTVSLFGSKSLKVNVASGVDQYQFVGYHFGTNLAGRVFTMSCYIKTLNVNTAGVSCRTYWQDASGAWVMANVVVSNPVSGTSDWKRISATSTAPSGATRVFILIAPEVKDGVGTYWIDGVQIEEKAFASPYVDGSIGATDLEYNLNRDYGLDWNGDWSIVYWKKPVGGHDNTLTGYSIESLGCNSNSVGGGYSWWGRETTVNYITASPVGRLGSSINISNYFNKWHMVSIVRSGGNITWTFYNIDGTPIKSGVWNIGTIASNYYVNQYGYDLKFGWDNTNTSNTYYRDLIVAKRALTDAELNDLANDKISIKKDRVRVNGIISENIILT